MVIPSVQPATPDQPAFVRLALQHDHGIQVHVMLQPSAAEHIARNIVEAATAVRTGKTPKFSPNRTA